jgi:hypothetical protein
LQGIWSNTYSRNIENEAVRLAGIFPALVIVGPRQVGKTSLVKHLQTYFPNPSAYLDLELPEDYNKFKNPALFLESLLDKTVIIDEVQRLPALFPILRALIDRHRRPGRFILLGSASPELIQDTSESLAGRVAYLELPPFSWNEVEPITDYRTHWLRGGFPEALLADSDELSFEWRLNFIQSYLERDLPLLGLKADPQLVRRLWTMIAHMNGGVLKMEKLAGSLGITNPTVKKYLDFLESAYLIRRLQPFHFNIKKRLVKSPKIYIRDSGILHSLLNIGNFEEMLGSPSVGNSWESYIIQGIHTRLPSHTELFYYRTQDGTEADLVIAPGGIPKILVEIKFTSAPALGKGFHIAKSDLKTNMNFVVCPVETGYPFDEGTWVVSHFELDKIFEAL